MFSKALFKQSAKANGLMWIIITAAECFMLACVMVISGSGNVGNVKNAVEDTIIEKEIDASLEKRALAYYDNSSSGLNDFDNYYAADFIGDYGNVLTYKQNFDKWLLSKPVQNSGESDEAYQTRLTAWKDEMPESESSGEQVYAYTCAAWAEKMPSASSYQSLSDYQAALAAWQQEQPTAEEADAAGAFLSATSELKESTLQKASQEGYEADSSEAKELLGEVFYALKPTSDFDSIFTSHEETVPSDYDVQSLISHISQGDVSTYIKSEERNTYRNKRAENSSSIFLADNMSQETTIEMLLTALSKYGVSESKFNSFGYTYQGVKEMSESTIVSFQARYDYELKQINQKKADGEYENEASYEKAISDMKETLSGDLSKSLLASLPEDVSKAIEDVGQMDLYSLIVGSVFFKIAGLLLPIIYTIMASNNLIASQVDSGSMAYVLSPGTKRQSVVFTQAMYLTLSLLGMFACTLITSCICFRVVNVTDTGLNYGRLCLINLGAFLTLYAMSGLNFFTSCYFDRTKNSMALGGGLSIFFLVATILGLFGSPVIPSVVRFDALNNFNYVSIITLFDVISITDGTTAFIWKFAILFVLGLSGYVAGSMKFVKKDLPL
jgi:ABC-2 type transport system permease protein